MADVDDSKTFVLREKLPLQEFSRPILEKYPNGQRFLGLYVERKGTGSEFANHLSDSVAAFLHLIARTERVRKQTDLNEVYPQWENRKRVAAHVRRERSPFLAAQRKAMDNYICQICYYRFFEKYGELGRDFAESHHRLALNNIPRQVRTRIEDLITVCADCHRMLHRMSGKPEDIAKLRKIVQTHQKRRNR